MLIDTLIILKVGFMNPLTKRMLKLCIQRTFYGKSRFEYALEYFAQVRTILITEQNARAYLHNH